ncbi:MAG: nucleotidyltransferase domain-containing protein [Longimicrobiales bacterium]|nr:nucleotidyltransferase domain-containing protein [Longimicrobiales bacterium]
MEIDSDLVREIVDRLTRIAELDRIILFGSGATGRMTPDSDVDLLVVQADVQDPRGESRRLRAALAGVPVPFDVIVMSTDRFEETKGVIGGIAYPANRYGKVIHEAA